jgi:hypothetical protein
VESGEGLEGDERVYYRYDLIFFLLLDRDFENGNERKRKTEKTGRGSGVICITQDPRRPL